MLLTAAGEERAQLKATDMTLFYRVYTGCVLSKEDVPT